MSLRRIETRDWPTLAALHAQSFPRPWSSGELEDMAARPGAVGLVAAADAGAEPQGFILCWRTLDEAEILTLVVTPSARGAGLGRSLLEEAAAVCAAEGAQSLFLEVAQDNAPALALYRGAGFEETVIMSYASKFASAFYGPFRDAADSAPTFGDRSSYQHDPANLRHARRELMADVEEGADILMVKPGMPYLDIVRLAREVSDLPIAAYNVSGEYSMVKAAAERGWLDERRIVLETLTAFRRAGADLVITYHALDAARWLD